MNQATCKGHLIKAGEHIQTITVEDPRSSFLVKVSKNARLIDFSEQVLGWPYEGPVTLAFATDYADEEERCFYIQYPYEDIQDDCFYIGCLYGGKILLEVAR